LRAVQAVGDDIIDSIVGDNIPVLTEDEKYNETVTSSASRIRAAIKGEVSSKEQSSDFEQRKRQKKQRICPRSILSVCLSAGC
jgi:hypothetical protein